MNYKSMFYWCKCWWRNISIYSFSESVQLS